MIIDRNQARAPRAAALDVLPQPAVATGAGTGPHLAEAPNLERKYVFSAGRAQLLEAWLDAMLLPDPAFARGRVTSLYFDTPALDLYAEKRNSTYLKTKVRLRWYEGACDDGQLVPCYIEVKKKIGAVRTKVRTRVEIPWGTLANRLFTDPVIRDAPGLVDPGLQGEPLVPMVVVQYERRRFIDPVSRSRVALDTGIRCPRANAAFLPANVPVILPVGVLETKGSERGLPITLTPMADHFRKEAFSKYGMCCEQLLEPLARRL